MAILNSTLDSFFNELQHEVLDFVECAVGKDRYGAVRSKILGVCNKKRRELREELKRNWIVKHTHVPPVTGRDVVVVGRDLVKDKESERHEQRENKET